MLFPAIIISILFGCALLAPITDSKIEVAKQQCVNSTGADLSKIQFHAIPNNDRDFNNYIVCLFEKLKLQKENGDINLEKFREYFDDTPYQKQLEGLLYTCNNTGGQTKLEKALNFTLCISNYFKNLKD